MDYSREEYLRFCELSWYLLESKCKYYKNAGKDCDSDIVYDQKEQEYKDLAVKLNMEPTASDMVGFDTNRPSCRLVMAKLKIK